MPGLRKKAALVAGILCLCAPISGSSDISELPELGDTSASVLSPVQERILGEKFMRSARQRLNFLDQPEILDYLQRLGNKLVSYSDNSGYEFRFFIINDPSLNAFAVPGGYIGIHTGLIMATRSEDELAAVLAHEIAHITQRHMPRLLASTKENSIPTMVALIAGALLGGQAGQAAIALSSAASLEQQLDYTREFEREADHLGMRTLASAQYDPHAMPDFFKQLQNWGRIYDTNLPEFLRTHPVTTGRIADSLNRAEQYPATRPRLSAQFEHVRAIIRVLTAPSRAQAVHEFSENLSAGHFRDKDAETFGLALAMLHANRYDRGREIIVPLAERKPGEPLYRILRAEIEIGSGQFTRGLAVYRRAIRELPDYKPLTRRYASALLRAGRPKPAYELLDQALRKTRDDPALYQMMATAAGESGHRVAAHRALAEYYYLNGNLRAAVDQLHIARRLIKNDFYLHSSVDARIRAVQEEIAETRKP
jgi:predicted Zn-dependent protease